MADKTPITFNIQDNKTFFADEVSITNNPVKFIIDFKCSSPRVDPRMQQGVPVVLEHNAVMMDTWLAKTFHRILGQHIEKYEEQFGTIEEPEQIKTAKQQQHDVSSTTEKPGYFG